MGAGGILGLAGYMRRWAMGDGAVLREPLPCLGGCRCVRSVSPGWGGGGWGKLPESGSGADPVIRRHPACGIQPDTLGRVSCILQEKKYERVCIQYSMHTL